MMRRFSAWTAGAVVWLTMSAACAATPSACAHPVESGTCFGVFSLVSLPYIVIAATYALGALLIMRPQFEHGRHRAALLGLAPFSWVACMLAFTIGGAAGLLAFPHDASPFFFVDWFVVITVLVLQTGYVALAYAWRRPQQTETAQAAEASAA